MTLITNIITKTNFSKMHIFLLIFLSFTIFIAWPANFHVTFEKPHQLDLGFPYIFILSISLIGLLLPLNIKQSLYQAEFSFTTICKYISCLFLQIAFILITTLPLSILFLLISILTWPEFLATYIFALCASIGFGGLNTITRLHNFPRQLAACILGVTGLVYVIGLALLFLNNGITALSTYLFHLLWALLIPLLPSFFALMFKHSPKQKNTHILKE